MISEFLSSHFSKVKAKNCISQLCIPILTPPYLCSNLSVNFCCDIHFRCFQYMSLMSRKSKLIKLYISPEKTIIKSKCDVSSFAQYRLGNP